MTLPFILRRSLLADSDSSSSESCPNKLSLFGDLPDFLNYSYMSSSDKSDTANAFSTFNKKCFTMETDPYFKTPKVTFYYQNIVNPFPRPLTANHSSNYYDSESDKELPSLTQNKSYNSNLSSDSHIQNK